MATTPDLIKIKPGFRIELLYSVPRDEQGSWVSLCTDPKGRLYASDQYGSLYRITPPKVGQTDSCQVERIPVDLGEAHGLLWAFDSLYVMVNHGNKYASGLYRLRDTDGDDQIDAVEKLRSFDGEGEHGPHAIVLGPDGKSLYVVIGNHTKLTDVNTSRVPRVWAEDLIVPRMWDAKGHAHGILAPGGHILKTDPEGKSWELVSIGYRNSYDAAFDKDGELFTFDSDMEWDMNTPWYRATRVCHVTSGSEFGWRSGSGKWPVYYPDSLPPAVDIGPGSPTGMCFGNGARFPAKYQNALFICDWSYGKLYAVHLNVAGASYSGEFEEFLSGAPLPMTDIVISPTDGAMYFTTGGRKTTSGLYRVTYIGGDSADKQNSAKPHGDQRALRHRLESFHGRRDISALDAIWSCLGNDDRFIRFAARTALEHQDPVVWQDRALHERTIQRSLTALLALARVGDKSLGPKLLEALAAIPIASLTESQLLELIRVYELTLLRMAPSDTDATAAIVRRFDPLWPSFSSRVDSETCKLLAYLNASCVPAKGLLLLDRAPTQEEQMDYAATLRSAKSGWTVGLKRQYFEWFHKASGYRGGASFEGFVKMIKNDAVSRLTPDEKTQLTSILEARTAAAAPQVPPRPYVKKWTMAEIVPLVEGQLHNRDFDRGRVLFSATRCVSCHRFDNEGGANGPDLTGVSGRFTVQDLLESIVEPSKVVSDQYVATTITLNNGKLVTGRIVNLTGDSLRINTDMFEPNALAAVERSQIEHMEPSKISMMPDGLVDTCTAEEIKDLVAYLLSKGDRGSRMFKQK